MSLDANKVVVTRFFDEILNRQRPDAIAELVDAAIVVHHPLLDGGRGGIQDVARLMEHFAMAFPDLAYTVDDLVSGGDRIAARWTAHGTHRGVFKGPEDVPPSGRGIEVPGIDLFAIANGKIVETWVSSDLLGLMQQIGAFERPTGGATTVRDEPFRSRPN